MPVSWRRSEDTFHRAGCRYVSDLSVRWEWGNKNLNIPDEMARRWILERLAQSEHYINPCKVCCPEAYAE